MAKRAQPVLYDADTLLHPTHHPVSIWDSEEVLVHQVVSMKKMNEKLGHIRPRMLYEKLNALKFVPQQELSREQAYWLPANEIASQASNPNSPVTPFVHNRPPPSQVLFHLQKVNAVFHQFEGIIKERTTQKPDYVSEWCYDYAKQFVEQQLVPFYEHFKKHIQSANETIFREVKEYEQIFDDLDAEYERCVLDNKNLTIEKKNLLIKNDCLIAEYLRSACDREHTKVLELEAEVLKQQKMVIESEKRNSHLQKTHIDLQLKFQNYKQCIDTSSASNAIFEINKLSKQLQGKDDTIRNLDAQINIMKVENVSLKRRYDELSKANTHSRTVYTEKLSALTTQHTKLQAQVTGKTSSGPSTSETPKVLAPGMYNLGSKYIPPPKRANWVKTTPLLAKSKAFLNQRKRLCLSQSSTIVSMVSGFWQLLKTYDAIVGYGDYKLGDTIISRVYYVEGLKHNLFSVGQFCDGDLGGYDFLCSRTILPHAELKKFYRRLKELSMLLFASSEQIMERSLSIRHSTDGLRVLVFLMKRAYLGLHNRTALSIRRYNQTLMEAARTYTLHAKHNFMNCEGKEPNLQYFQVFGSLWLSYSMTTMRWVKLRRKADYRSIFFQTLSISYVTPTTNTYVKVDLKLQSLEKIIGDKVRLFSTRKQLEENRRDVEETFHEFEVSMVWILFPVQLISLSSRSNGFSKLKLDESGDVLRRTKLGWSRLCPLEMHLTAIKRIFRYLKGTIHMGLCYPKDSGFELKAFADADYAGCHDTRRSTSGSAQFLGHRLVSWSSKKQKSTAISTTEAGNTSAPIRIAGASYPLGALSTTRLGFAFKKFRSLRKPTPCLELTNVTRDSQGTPG
ncbi:hypothetical protein Tco_1394280 [Tanacetum coccineum]